MVEQQVNIKYNISLREIMTCSLSECLNEDIIDFEEYLKDFLSCVLLVPSETTNLQSSLFFCPKACLVIRRCKAHCVWQGMERQKENVVKLL